jgi:hypothetical protein
LALAIVEARNAEWADEERESCCATRGRSNFSATPGVQKMTQTLRKVPFDLIHSPKRKLAEVTLQVSLFCRGLEVRNTSTAVIFDCIRHHGAMAKIRVGFIAK